MAPGNVFRNPLVNLIIASLFVLGLAAFEFWDRYLPSIVHDRNEREISKMKVDSTDFSFAVFGDHRGHAYYFKPLLRDVSRDKKIAFVMDLGDLVREGRKSFYRRFLRQIGKNLTVPLLAAIGNHDLYRGSANYREIFGSTYYSFQIGQSYFIVLDASMVSGLDWAQRHWLEDELQRSQVSKVRLVFMHVPPFDPRKGNGDKHLADGEDLLELFKRYQVTHLFCSHIHGYFSGIWEGVPYTITGGAGAGLQGTDPDHFFHHYVKVHISGGKVETEIRRIDVKKSSMKDFLSFMKDYGPEWGLLAGLMISLFALGRSIKRGYRKSKHLFNQIAVSTKSTVSKERRKRREEDLYHAVGSPSDVRNHYRSGQ